MRSKNGSSRTASAPRSEARRELGASSARSTHGRRRNPACYDPVVLFCCEQLAARLTDIEAHGRKQTFFVIEGNRNGVRWSWTITAQRTFQADE